MSDLATQNLNTKYKFLEPISTYLGISPIAFNKCLVTSIDHEELLSKCPIIELPVGTLIYHSATLTCERLEKVKKEFVDRNFKYTKNFGCEICGFQPGDFPTEEPGTKPRIYELRFNPNGNARNEDGEIIRDECNCGVQFNETSCYCSNSEQSRFFCNFNFIGNYAIYLQRGDTMKGTQVSIVIKPLKLLDISYVSLELGFSPKRTGLRIDDRSTTLMNGFGKTSVYSSFCRRNGLDGLIMTDPSDTQQGLNITNQDEYNSACLTCFSYYSNFLCPEMVLLHNNGLRPADQENYLGTDKLANIGLVDLVKEIINSEGIKTIEKLERSQVTKLFNNLFFKYQNTINEYLQSRDPTLSVKFLYDWVGDNFLIKKMNIAFYKNNVFQKNVLPIELFTTLGLNFSNCYLIPANDYELQLEIGDTNIFTLDNDTLQKVGYNVDNLQTSVVQMTTHFLDNQDLGSVINFRTVNSTPLFSSEYKYLDGNQVLNFASERLFSYIIQNIFELDLLNDYFVTPLKFLDTLNRYIIGENLNSKDKFILSLVRTLVKILDNKNNSNFDEYIGLKLECKGKTEERCSQITYKLTMKGYNDSTFSQYFTRTIFPVFTNLPNFSLGHGSFPELNLNLINNYEILLNAYDYIPPTEYEEFRTMLNQLDFIDDENGIEKLITILFNKNKLFTRNNISGYYFKQKIITELNKYLVSGKFDFAIRTQDQYNQITISYEKIFKEFMVAYTRDEFIYSQKTISDRTGYNYLIISYAISYNKPFAIQDLVIIQNYITIPAIYNFFMSVSEFKNAFMTNNYQEIKNILSSTEGGTKGFVLSNLTQENYLKIYKFVRDFLVIGNNLKIILGLKFSPEYSESSFLFYTQGSELDNIIFNTYIDYIDNYLFANSTDGSYNFEIIKDTLFEYLDSLINKEEYYKKTIVTNCLTNIDFEIFFQKLIYNLNFNKGVVLNETVIKQILDDKEIDFSGYIDRETTRGFKKYIKYKNKYLKLKSIYSKLKSK